MNVLVFAPNYADLLPVSLQILRKVSVVTHLQTKKHKYMIARSECSETLAFLLMSIELGFCSHPDAHRAVDLSKTTGKLLTGLISSHKTIPTPYSQLPTPNHALR